MPRKSNASADATPPAAGGVELDRKRAPTQTRALETCERILDAAANLLGEVGIERLSTNLICERAGLSPPALYRYYPNKYAVLAELGVRLMMSQNELLEQWATPATMRLPAAKFEAAHPPAVPGHAGDHAQGDRRRMDHARAARGAVARAGAHRVARARHRPAGGRVRAWPGPAVPQARVRLVSRLAIEVMYSAQELLVDDATLDAEEVAAVMSHMVTTQVVQLRKERA